MEKRNLNLSLAESIKKGQHLNLMASEIEHMKETIEALSK
jgi:ornithine cyclodeaminase/alanine dehydrogenase-like protein (mu-crystallin family)